MIMVCIPKTESVGARAAADESFRWYVRHSNRARASYWASEIILLLFTAAVPISVIVDPRHAQVPAVLGGVVVVLAGFRAIFHWHENWTRFTLACSEINAELRLYNIHAEPYDRAKSRDTLLLTRLNLIEMRETSGWTTLSTPSTGRHGT
jgi:hypothetical protein